MTTAERHLDKVGSGLVDACEVTVDLPARGAGLIKLWADDERRELAVVPTLAVARGRVVCLFSLCVVATMGQVASAFPTAGGMYHRVSILGGRGWDWNTTWFNLAGLVTVRRPGFRARPGHAVRRGRAGHRVAHGGEPPRHPRHAVVDGLQRLLDRARRCEPPAALGVPTELGVPPPLDVHHRQRTSRWGRGHAGVPTNRIAPTAGRAGHVAAGVHHHRVRRERPRRRGDERSGSNSPARDRAVGARVGRVRVGDAVCGGGNARPGRSGRAGGNAFTFTLADVLPRWLCFDPGSDTKSDKPLEASLRTADVTAQHNGVRPVAPKATGHLMEAAGIRRRKKAPATSDYLALQRGFAPDR